ncbi:MAG: hypothetical protein Q8M94_22910 [Ignavibacteria bacterium]|nr:hypothetical protein [Ignavibacteria bacterium]
MGFKGLDRRQIKMSEHIDEEKIRIKRLLKRILNQKRAKRKRERKKGIWKRKEKR